MILFDERLKALALRLVFFTKKDPELLATDLAVASFLILRADESGACFDTHGAIAHYLNVERGTVWRSFNRLNQARWIEKLGSGSGVRLRPLTEWTRLDGRDQPVEQA